MGDYTYAKRNREYRQRLKSNPIAFEAYKEKTRLRVKKYRQKKKREKDAALHNQGQEHG